MDAEKKQRIVAEIVEAFRSRCFTPVTGTYSDGCGGRCAVGAVTVDCELARGVGRKQQFMRQFVVDEQFVCGLIQGFDAEELGDLEGWGGGASDGYEVGAAVRAAVMAGAE